MTPSESPLLAPHPEPKIVSPWKRALSIVALGLAMSIFAWWQMIAQYPHTQLGDGQTFFKTMDAARVSVQHFHELPLWNPYECGGIPLYDNPQAPTGSPLVYLSLWFGTTATLYIWYIVHGALGFAGMWLFARDELQLTRVATFAGATIWGFSGVVQQHFSGGHVAFAAFVYLPIALLLWRRAESSIKHAVLLGLLVAWMIYEGAVYPLPHTGLFLAAETLMRIWQRKRIIPILRAAGIVVVVALVFGAARFFPVFWQLAQHKRDLGEEHDAMQWQTFKDMFLARHHEWGAPGQEYVWPEFGAYLGPIVVAAALVGILVSGTGELWLLVLLAFAVALM